MLEAQSGKSRKDRTPSVKKILLLGIALLAVAVGAVLFMDFDSPGFGRAVLKRASETTGVELEASRFRLNLLKRLELKDLVATSSFPGGRYEIELGAMRLEHRVLPLLGGRLVVERIVIERPRVEVIRGKAGGGSTEERRPPGSGELEPGEAEPSEPREPAEPARSGLRLEVKEIVLEDGTILLQDRDQDKDQLSLTGLDVTLRELSYDGRALTPIHALKGTGNVDFDVLHLD